MTRIIFDVAQNNGLVRAENAPCQAAVERNRDFRQLFGVGAGGSCKEETFILFVLQQNRRGFAIQQLSCRGGNKLKKVIEVQS